MFAEVTHFGEWDEAREILEEPGFVAMEDNGYIEEGDYVVLSRDPGIEGLYIDARILGNENTVERDDRSSDGFYFMNSDNSPVELKYRFSEELRSYPELTHVHNTPELYVPTGNFEMEVASKESESGFTIIEFDEPLIIPAGMYHGIQSREPGSQLIVARGDPELQETVVGKWDLQGDQLYSHVEDIDFPKLSYYEDEKDEMHGLW